MQLNNQLNPEDALNQWLCSPQGLNVLQHLGRELIHMDRFLYGTHMLQLGLCEHVTWRASVHFPCAWVVSPVFCKKCTLIASNQALPFADSSIDCILAPFSMELCRQKKILMDEIDRVLKPMGYVIFFGVNPWSLWGLALRISGLKSDTGPAIKACSSMYLQHQMLALGYQQIELNNCYFIPPVCFISPNAEEKWVHRLEFLNEMGKMLWPGPAGFYCLVMQKYSTCITPLSPQALIA